MHQSDADIDREIDAATSELVAGDTDPIFRSRVLTSIVATTDGRARWRWTWIALPAASGIALIMALAAQNHSPSQPPGMPAAETVVPQMARETIRPDTPERSTQRTSSTADGTRSRARPVRALDTEVPIEAESNTPPIAVPPIEIEPLFVESLVPVEAIPIDELSVLPIEIPKIDVSDSAQ